MSSLLPSLVHAVRGALIGAAELVPGISGGTVAMIVGVYQRLITSAGHFVGGSRLLLTDRAAARAEFAKVRWDVVVPVLIGMVPAALLTARLIAPIAERHPVPTFGLFLGMSAAAVVVPVSMIRTEWTWRWVGLAAVVALAAFLLVGLPPQELPSHPVLIFLAASVAVCALAMPGLSGSFLLLTLGLYQPTLAALNERDYGYIAVFVAGMVVGLSVFVRILQRLLENHRTVTLVVVTGVMVGALRALWPWQSPERELLRPDGQVGMTFGLLGLGAAVVLVVAWLGRDGEEEHPPEPVEPGEVAGSTRV